ncbi:MAG: hypothetical protein M1827_003355 [Pycnora praestabilis]|nr:MAG: hypothetical protein M1827_003355 [Pycnora praestabilis]
MSARDEKKTEAQHSKSISWASSLTCGDAVIAIPDADTKERFISEDLSANRLRTNNTNSQEELELERQSVGKRESWPIRVCKSIFRYRAPDDQLVCRTLEECPDGYPKLAAFSASDQNFKIYRGFNYLHARLLLYQQDEITRLEKDLDEMDKDDFEDEDEQYKICLRSRDKDDARAGQPRRELLMKIKEKLMEYGNLSKPVRPSMTSSPRLTSTLDEVLIKAREVTAFQRPSGRDYRSVRKWISGVKPLVEDEERYIRCREDLITLRHGRECAGFDGFVEEVLQKLNCRIIRYMFCTPELRRKTEDKHIYYYSSERVNALVGLIITFIILVLLVLPVAALYRLSSFDTQHTTIAAIGVLMVFTLLFSAIMSCLTKARRHEIFAASAGYCAVLVVFITNFSDIPGSS